MGSNGRPVVEIYGKHEANNKDVQGGILSMNLLRANGSYIGYYQVQTESAAKNIHVRTGCHCNPGACRKYLKESESVLKTLSLEKDSCSDEIDMVNGKPVGGIRVSLGYLTNFNDIMRYVDFVKTYVDAWRVCFILDNGIQSRIPARQGGVCCSRAASVRRVPMALYRKWRDRNRGQLGCVVVASHGLFLCRE